MGILLNHNKNERINIAVPQFGRAVIFSAIEPLNMGFSAMLAEKYILIVPFAYHLESRLNGPACRSCFAEATRRHSRQVKPSDRMYHQLH
jgi:hypothetical protein